ncbi:hypothetical protein DPMN_015982 [Dreissena polymorpha]|uniref:Uncharacterized protein n=1 Tax=Dreissena polymorpha TaxID=45954 RepID=A0A9D4S6P9_DREPO|nr:hypothetical protein DPMN_015982 [Dreissena polymorpha]
MCESPAGAQTVFPSSQTVRVSPDSAPTVWETVWHRLGVAFRYHDSFCIVADCLRVSCRCPGGLGDCLPQSGILLQVPKRSWHHLRLSGSVLKVRRRYWRLAPSHTVCECPAGASLVFKTF